MKKKDQAVEEAVEEVVETEATDQVETEVADDIEIVEEASEAQKLAELLAKKEVEAKENHLKWQRSLAEFDNFRKRTIKEKSNMYDRGKSEVVEKLLPILDNFERALSHIEDEKNAEGIEMIYKQYLSVLDDLGVEEIDAVGKEFDPNLHNAVMHEENDEYGENVVIEVLQKGFIYKEKVLRHSLVRVAN